MGVASTLTAERLRELLLYNPDTGMFTQRLNRRGVRAGQVAGTLMKSGYRQLQVEGRKLYAHRLAWLYVYSEWPTANLDHRNENPDDNRISNLREDVDGLNLQNQSRPCRNNTSGFLGVSRNRSGWAARIYVGGRDRHLGTFDTPKEAAEVYLAAKRCLHPFWDEEAAT